MVLVVVVPVTTQQRPPGFHSNNTCSMLTLLTTHWEYFVWGCFLFLFCLLFRCLKIPRVSSALSCEELCELILWSGGMTVPRLVESCVCAVRGAREPRKYIDAGEYSYIPCGRKECEGNEYIQIQRSSFSLIYATS